eukprot:1145486-Pelagomonas_calceolata.AAC.2
MDVHTQIEPQNENGRTEKFGLAFPEASPKQTSNTKHNVAQAKPTWAGASAARTATARAGAARLGSKVLAFIVFILVAFTFGTSNNSN